ncbi:MAG TPA: hypothetical protein DCQ76_03035 [Ruminococcaceae bacterium]|nr:hypothetical protein [Oscillospiraceae bacterium]
MKGYGDFVKAVITADLRDNFFNDDFFGMPKILLPILGKPLISYIIDILSFYGTNEIVLLLEAPSEKISEYLNGSSDCGVKIRPIVGKSINDAFNSFLNSNEETDDDLILINDNVLFDFDLTEAEKYHRSVGADITVLTSHYDRTSGERLVFTSPSGKITGFSGSVGRGSLLTDKADTGIYIISRKILKMLHGSAISNFSNDILPEMLSKNKNLFAIRCAGYRHSINTVLSYIKCTRDVLDGKTVFSLPEICDGIYSNSELPCGKYNITPPVFIGENAEISDGADLGPYTVVGDGCFIGEKAFVRGSIMLCKSAVLRGADISGAVMGVNSVAEENSKMSLGSVLCEKSTVGRNMTVGENARVTPKPHGDITVPESLPSAYYFAENIASLGSRSTDSFFGDFDIGLFCEAGRALGSCEFGMRTGIGYDDSVSSSAAVKAVTAGLISSGSHVFDFGTCFLSEVGFFSSFCSLGCGIFIYSEKNGIHSVFYGDGGLPLSPDSEQEFERRMENSEFRRCSAQNMRAVSDISSMSSMYRRELLRQSGDMLGGISANVMSDNKDILLLMEDCLLSLGCDKGDDITFKITKGGTEISAFCRECGWIDMDKLISLCCLYEFQCGHDVAVPYDAPAVINTMADGYEKRVLRYPVQSETSVRNELKYLSSKQYFLRDGLFMAVKILGIMRETGYSFPKLLSQIPKFFVKHKTVSFSSVPEDICRAFPNDTVYPSYDGMTMYREGGRVLLKPSETGEKLEIVSEAVSYEMSRELCADIENKLRDFGTVLN